MLLLLLPTRPNSIQLLLFPFLLLGEAYFQSTLPPSARSPFSYAAIPCNLPNLTARLNWLDPSVQVHRAPLQGASKFNQRLHKVSRWSPSVSGADTSIAGDRRSLPLLPTQVVTFRGIPCTRVIEGPSTRVIQRPKNLVSISVADRNLLPNQMPSDWC